MDRTTEKLQGVGPGRARILLDVSDGCPLTYLKFDQTYPNTAGPFSARGVVSGRALCTFTIEGWSCGWKTLYFCNGSVLGVRDGEEKRWDPT